jgi:hypothetical protein
LYPFHCGFGEPPHIEHRIDAVRESETMAMIIEEFPGPATEYHSMIGKTSLRAWNG